VLRARNDDTATAPQNSSGLYYLHNDHLGTPRAVSDEGQQVTWRWISDPFGNGLPEEDPDGDGQHFTLNLRFPGQYYDEESGLHYNHFRYYDPSTGRYITSDPIGLDGGLNTYLYVNANPLIYIDPNGLGAVGALKCFYYSNKIRKYRDQCYKEYDNMCKNNPLEGGIKFISKYDSDWMSGALVTCTCTKATNDGNPGLCTDWITTCAVGGVGGGSKPRPK